MEFMPRLLICLHAFIQICSNFLVYCFMQSVRDLFINNSNLPFGVRSRLPIDSLVRSRRFYYTSIIDSISYGYARLLASDFCYTGLVEKKQYDLSAEK